MAEQTGEKTEQPTQRRLEDAIKRGQTPHSAEVQTVFVMLGAVAALTFSGRESWQMLVNSAVQAFSHLHTAEITANSLQSDGVIGVLTILKIAGPLVLATMICGLIAGAIQNRFQTAPDAISPDWSRVNPVQGFQRLFSNRTVVPTLIGFFKFAFVIALIYSELKKVLLDPVFTTVVSVGRLAEFLGETALGILSRVCLALVVIAVADYGYQFWRTGRDLMMTKDELKEETKNTEGNQQVKSARRRRRSVSKAKQLAEVAKADVIVTNPTRIAIALRYDRKTMKAPKVVAKGIRLNAARIREIAAQHQVPLIENKPLAQMLFKHARVNSEIPANLFAAVAEILAWVYRTNRYRYFSERNQV
ncbi:MAG TPA: EscU/YscU/HrcU family type III secretion system export apparatus switch protein [Candidatus Sulfotelmatobacter sp.]|nr:EscU/YscU/HrcU family type III secretion system export apparatus switch protein [Candidatus Sulfotelmatobacter sp.]